MAIALFISNAAMEMRFAWLQLHGYLQRTSDVPLGPALAWRRFGVAFALLIGDHMSLTDTFKTTPRSTLKNLVQILHDGQEGFHKAAEEVQDTEIKALFSRLSLQRSKFSGELESQLLTLGEEDPQNEGTTLSGKMHRGWMEVKSALGAHSCHAVLSEAERGEDAAVKAYKEALESELPAPIREIISTQAAEIQIAHNKVRDLRDAAKC